MKKAEAQEDVLRMLTVEGLTPRQAMLRRKISESRFYRILRELKKKGKISVSRGVVTEQGGSVVEQGGSVAPHRLHAERFRLRLARSSTIYRDELARKPKRMEAGNRVLLFRETVIVYSHQAFYGATAEASEAQSAEYWPTWMKALAERLNVSWGDVERVDAHRAYMNSELARNPEFIRKRLQVRGADGKVWFLTDGSLGKEDEAIGRGSLKGRAVVDRQLNSWRENPECPTIPELATLFKGMLEVMAAKEGYVPGKQRKTVVEHQERPDYAL